MRFPKYHSSSPHHQQSTLPFSSTTMMMIIKGILLNVITVGSQLSSFYNVHQSSLCRRRSDHILQENWASGLVGGRSYFAKKGFAGILQKYFFSQGFYRSIFFFKFYRSKLQENWAGGLVGERSYFAEKLYWNFTEVNLQQPCSENIFNERF